MKADGLENVRLQPVKVPHWVRGRECGARRLAGRARAADPRPRPERRHAGRAAITAPVVVVRSFDELTALGREKVEGRIVAFAPDWEGYGRTVRVPQLRRLRRGEARAVAALVRSATGRSLATPHTGAARYEEDVPRIPAASITVEDAEWLRRMAAAGETVTVSLSMEARLEGDADSANVIAEIRGRERPDEVVVMGGHSDSWDVGQGAHDDGCACVAAWQALTVLKELGLRPRRTLRVVLWVAEENSGRRRAPTATRSAPTCRATWRRSRWTAAASGRSASASGKPGARGRAAARRLRRRRSPAARDRRARSRHRRRRREVGRRRRRHLAR